MTYSVKVYAYESRQLAAYTVQAIRAALAAQKALDVRP